MALATPISRPAMRLAGWLGFIVGALHGMAGLTAAGSEFAAYAQRNFQQAQARYQQVPADLPAAWQFGRACFDLAEFATNNAGRASLAEQGIAACRLAVERDSNSAPAHYYLAMNLGQLARTKGLSALKLVDQMEWEFSRARDLDEHLDWAGPDRNLGLLYLDAPAIGSIGSRTGERILASHELQTLEAVWPAARTNFVGEAWAASWADWEPRLKKLKKRIEEHAKSFGTPREKP